MRVWLDDKALEAGATSIGEAIEGAAVLARQEGRMVVEVRVDGELWNEQQLASAAARAGQAGEVRCVSEDPRALVCETLSGAALKLEEADELQRRAAELIQADRRADAMAKLGDALSIWLSVHDVVARSAQALDLDLTSIQVGDGTVRDCVDRLNRQLRSLRDLLAADDPVGLADSLMYELPESVAQWREALQVMEQTVQEETP